MSAAAPARLLRPGAGGIGGWIEDHKLDGVGVLLGLLRGPFPIVRIGKTCFVTRYDDVREVLSNDAAFPVNYKPTLDIVTGGEPFMLGIADPAQVAADTAMLRDVAGAADIAGLAQDVAARAEVIVAGSGGALDLVSDLVTPASFGFLTDYLGLGDLPTADLRIWSTRLFAYVFFGGDAALAADAAEMAPLLRARIDDVIARAKAGGAKGESVLARMLRRHAQGDARYSDVWIRTTLVGMIVGGPPQPPIVVAHMLDQLFRRPDALATARAAALADDDAGLYGHLVEALRFKPLAPAVKRIAAQTATIAHGTAHERTIPAGTTVLVGIGSAMFDPRRIDEPARFKADRLDHEYFHYGFGAHECFARHMNRATLPAMVKPLLKRAGLRRTGAMQVNGPFPEALPVAFNL